MKYTNIMLKNIAEEVAQCIHTSSLTEKETAKYLDGIFKEVFTRDVPEKAAKAIRERRAYVRKASQPQEI